MEPSQRSAVAEKEVADWLKLRLEFSDGEPVVHTWVEVLRGDRDVGEEPIHADEARTDADGALRIAGFDGPGVASVEGVTSEPLRLPLASGRGEKTLRLPGDCFIEGVLRVDGRAPREPVELGLIGGQGFLHGRARWTGRAGSFRFLADPGSLHDLLIPFQLELVGSAPMQSSVSLTSSGFGAQEMVGVQAPVRDLVIETRSIAAVRGRILDRGGAPIQDGSVAWKIGDDDEAWGSWGEAVTDRQGRFAVFLPGDSDLTPSPWEFEFISANGEWAEAFSLPAFDPRIGVDIGDVRLRRTRTIEVRTVDGLGYPVARAELSVQSALRVWSRRTDEDGHGTLPGVPHFTKSFRASGRDHGEVEVDLPVMVTEPVLVVLPGAASLEVKVEGKNDWGYRGLTAFVVTRGPLFARKEPHQGRWNRGWLNPEGVATNKKEEPRLVYPCPLDGAGLRLSAVRGEQNVTVRVLDRVGALIGTKDVWIDGEGCASLTFVVGEPRKVSGTVLRADGSPAEGGTISLLAAAPERLEEASRPEEIRLNWKGEFQLLSVFAERLDIRVAAPGEPDLFVKDVHIPKDGRLEALRLPEKKDVRLEVRTTSGEVVRDGAPYLTDIDGVSVPMEYRGEGRWLAKGAPRIAMEIHYENHGFYTRLPLGAGELERQLVLPEPGSLEVTWELRELAETARLAVWLTPQNDAEILTEGAAFSSSGTVVFERVFPGRYEVSLYGIREGVYEPIAEALWVDVLPGERARFAADF